MLQQFKSFIQEQNLFDPSDRVLLTVSGGLDSMVMAELFHQAGFPFGIAHCNFQLRGEESDEDERFVESMAKHYQVPFYATHFRTADFANLHHVSIQMAARELRYAWFEEIREKEGYDSIATAHHLDDQVETFLINLLRGTGIAGLHGIPVRKGPVIRPLLFASREEIIGFAKEQHIPFREDSSNSTLTYTRNRIRHQLIPLLHSIDPNYANQITGTINRIREVEAILQPLIGKCRDKVIRREQERWMIEISELRKLKPLKAWMYELLSPFELNETTIRNIIRSLDQESGRSFRSASFRIIKDRSRLIITPIVTKEPEKVSESYLIEETTKVVNNPIRLTLTSADGGSGLQISGAQNTATLDYDKISFPLLLRKWQPGDYFYPFGMNKRKKLSDFFIDEKIPIPDKESCWLLCSGNRIVWVTGHRIDHRYRVTSRTKKLLIVDYLPKKK